MEELARVAAVAREQCESSRFWSPIGAATRWRWLGCPGDVDARVQAHVPAHDGFLTAMNYLEVGCGTEPQATERLGLSRTILTVCGFLAVCGLVGLNAKVM